MERFGRGWRWAGIGLALVMGARASPIFRTDPVFQPVRAERHMVVAAEAEAARAGLAVLEAGGNAMDAGICVGFALAVTLPRAGNLGGGGFLLYHDAANGQVHALDYREVAPRAAYRDLFLDESGRADPEKSRFSPLAVGVPGTVDGLLEAHRRFGTLPLAELLEPAIRLAEGGFRVGPELAASLAQAHRTQRLSPAARLVYFRPDGTPLEAGDWLRQGDLAASLRRIAADGRDGFYTGPTAEAIVETLGRDGGLLTIDDLRRYTPVWREPVQGTYREHTVYSMPPPSSGGVHLVQMLQVLEAFPLADWGPNSQRAVHHMAEAMKRAYADRSRHLGDPDFHPVPVAELLSEAYTGRVQARIDPEHPTPSERIEPGELLGQTDKESMIESAWHWHTSDLTAPVELTAGTYWLAASFNGFTHLYSYDSGSGKTRHKNYDGVNNGFISNWGSSNGSYTRRMSIYAIGEATGSEGEPMKITWIE